MKPKCHIYIVDDEPFNLLLISRKLKQQFNCSTSLFKSIPEAIQALKKTTPDLVLCDYRFSEGGTNKLTGDYLIRWIKENNCKASVVMYSSFQNLELAVRLIQKGATDFIVRDSNFLDKLMNRVKIHLRRLRTKNDKRISKSRILLSIVGVSGILLYLHMNEQSLLFNISILMLTICAMILFLKEPLDKISNS